MSPNLRHAFSFPLRRATHQSTNEESAAMHQLYSPDMRRLMFCAAIASGAA